MKTTLLTLRVALGVAAATAVASDANLREKAKSAGLEAIPYGVQPVEDNPVTREKIALGTMLFFDPRLSASH
jgi:cytochrome c peroxidase